MGVSNAWASVGVACANTSDYTVKLNAKKQTDYNNWDTRVMSKAKMTFDGKKLYISGYDAPYNGFEVMQFQYHNDNGWVEQVEVFNSWKETNFFYSAIYNYDKKEWYPIIQLNSNARLYFDATGWNETDGENIKLCIGHSNGQHYYAMQRINYTKLFYINPDQWTDARGFGVVGNTTASSGQNWLTNVSEKAKEFTGFINYNLISAADNNAYLMVNKGKSGEQPEMSYYDCHYDTQNGLNYTQTVKYAILTDGTTYTTQNSGTTPAKISVSSYKFTDGIYDQVSPETKTLSKGSSIYSQQFIAARTATTTLTVDLGSLEPNYKFEGWYDENGEQLTTEFAYTYYPTTENTIYARFKEAPPRTVYLKPSHSWKSNNAQFAVKYGGTNHMMIEVEECCEEKYYKVTIPSQCSKFNFVRLSDNSTTEWNVTGEISVPTDGKNLYDMTKIYLKPNANWKSDGARFAAYFFVSNDMQNKTKWMSMLSTDEDGVFYCDFPTEHTFDRVSLTRMNGAESYNDWAYRLNQTKDIDLFQGYNSYELEEGKWGKDNSNPQKDDEMNVIYKCKWTTYNPTYSVTLEPTPYGHYTVEYNGRTYKSATDKNVVIHHVPLGATIRVSKGTPDNSAEYTDDMLLQKASGYGKTELKGGEYYDHTICGTTTITENFVTKNPHTVYLRVPTTLETWYEEGYVTPGANCVYYTHILGGGINLMEDVTGTIKGEDGYNYYQFTIPAGYRTFCFQYKSATTPESYTPRNYTANFTHAMPFINGLNCFTILGSNDDDYYYGEWGTLLQNGDYRLLYVEQVVEKDADGYTVITRKKAHPSDVVKASEITQEGVIVSLHTYKDRTYEAKLDGVETYTSSNNPEIILQRYDGSKWVDEEWHMVYGPLETLPIMANLPGRKNASPSSDIDDLQYHDGIEIIKQDVLNHPDKGNGVWNFYIVKNGSTVTLDLNRTHRYTGKYYIRTNAAFGEWNSYKGSDNHMTRSDVSKRNSNYSHYYCKWIDQEGTNVTYTIANDYGMAISDTLTADKTDIWGTPIADAKKIVTDGTLPTNNEYRGANVRFSWNEKSNFLHRAYLAGSTNVENRFLVLKGKSDQLYNAEGQALTQGANGSDRWGLNANEEIFTDISNWVYYADVQMVPNADLKLTAKYMDKVQYFVGQESNWNNTILKSEEECSDKYLIRLLYDFKTNELISAYVPGGQEGKEIEAIETNLMLIRKENETPRQLSFNANKMEDVGKQAYGVLELTQATLEDNKKNVYERSLYWISFPFDVCITDIFGFGEYGKHWIIQSYDGAKRAREGLWADSETNWVYHFDPSTLNAGTPYAGIMKKGVGYVVALNLKNIQAETPFVGRITTIALYFPSTTTITGHIVNENAVSISVPEHKCNINRPTPDGDRRIKDSHWNVIGVPSYINAVGDFTGKINTIAEDVKFYYSWQGDHDKYEVVSGKSGVSFNSLNAYMVQFAGNLQWTNVLNENPAGMAAKRNSDNMQEHHLCLELQQNGQEQDRTFIQLQEDEVTTAFDFNYDLCKIINKGANIYSLIATDRDPIEVAGNVLPIEEAIIPLGIKTDAAGEYTFAMPEGTDGIVVELIDYETNTRTNMLLDEYTINLGKGTNETRFALHVKPSKVTTSVEDVTTNTTGVKKYLIDGVLYMQKDGVLYDAQGKLVR